MGLAEEIYEDQENTDTLRPLKSAATAPYLVSVGFVRGAVDAVVFDCDEVELQCVDQILHMTVDSRMKVHALEQSRGGTQGGLLSTRYLKGENLQQILRPKLNELEAAISRAL